MEETITKLQPLKNDNVSKAIVTNIIKQGIDLHGLDGITSLSVLERKICELVSNYKGTSEERQLIFHLVQIWGGRTGRYIYVRPKDGFKWEEIDEIYEPFVETCSTITGTGVNDMQVVFNAMVKFNNVKYIGYSFITKHLRFWTYPKLKLQMFPPYDSNMSCKYMKRCYNYKDIIPYWQRIYKEASDKNLSVSEYERDIFNGLK